MNVFIEVACRYVGTYILTIDWMRPVESTKNLFKKCILERRKKDETSWKMQQNEPNRHSTYPQTIRKTASNR